MSKTIGPYRLNPRGDYNPAADPLYSLLDLVSDGGGSFVYINDTPSNEPTSSTSHWQQIASVGGQDILDAATAARDAAEGYKDAAAASAAQLQAGIGSPAGWYADLAAVKAENPAHDRTYGTENDGKLAYWSVIANDWVAGGVYQAASVASDVDELRSFSGIKKHTPTYNVSTVYKADGTTGSYTGWYSSQPVSITPRTKKMKVKGATFNDVPINCISFFDVNNNYIKGFGVYAGAVKVGNFYYQFDKEVDVPSKAKYFVQTKFSYLSNISINESVAYYITDEQFENMRPVGANLDFTNTDVPKSDGTFGQWAGWYSNDFSEIPNGVAAIHVDGASLASPNLLGIGFYDENFDFVSGFGTELGTAMYGDNYYHFNHAVNVPLGSKYYKCTHYNYGGQTSPTTIEYIYEPVINVLCIGDSLTIGDYGSVPPGTENVKMKSYPYFLQQDKRFNVINKGASGKSTITYWLDILPSLNLSVLNPDVVVIMLGTNNYGGSNYILDAFDTDIIPYSNYTDYAMTGLGAYCKIVEYILNETEGRAQIILCTCPFCDDIRRPGVISNINYANLVIPKIAKFYSIPYINVYDELGVNKITTGVYQPVDGLHFGEFGYQKLGAYIGSKIKSLISIG